MKPSARFICIAWTHLASALSLSGAESLDELLDTFAYNSDLSEKTKVQNAGNVIVFTRKRLDAMQARNLKDVIKTLPTLNYSENRYAIADPLYDTQTLTFNSNGIRVYVDDQEISSVGFGSGYFIVGNINLGFVDHIEIYGINPSFAYSTEPARILIKLYSKTPERDRGGRFETLFGTLGFNQQCAHYGQTDETLNYFAYLSRLDDRRTSVKSFEYDLKRDDIRYDLFGKVAIGTHRFYLQALQSRKDLFIGYATDAKTKRSETDSKYLHLGYEAEPIRHLKLGAVWEKVQSDNHFVNPLLDYHFDTDEEMVTVNAAYTFHAPWNQEILLGVKYRHKFLMFGDTLMNGHALTKPHFNTQAISTVFFEDRLELSQDWLLNLGTQYSYVSNNGGIHDQDLLLARFGVIYASSRWVVKTFFNVSEFMVEPYIYSFRAVVNSVPSIKPELLENVTHEIQYETHSHYFQSVFGYSRSRNAIVDGPSPLVHNPTWRNSVFGFLLYDYRYDIYNTISAQVSYRFDDKTPLNTRVENYKAVLRLLNRWGPWSFFNESIYSRNTLSQKDFVDYSAGITLKASNVFSLSLKGENIFSKARVNTYTREGLNQHYQWQTYDPIDVSPIEQRAYLSIEYLF